MQLYVTYAAQAVKHLVDNLRLVSVATLPSCGSYAAALHLSRRPQAKQPVATAAQRKAGSAVTSIIPRIAIPWRSWHCSQAAWAASKIFIFFTFLVMRACFFLRCVLFLR